MSIFPDSMLALMLPALLYAPEQFCEHMFIMGIYISNVYYIYFILLVWVSIEKGLKALAFLLESTCF